MNLLGKFFPSAFSGPTFPQSHDGGDAVRRQFLNIKALAEDIERLDPTALPSLVKVLLRPLQAEQMCGVVDRDYHRAPSAISPWGFFGHDLGDPSLSMITRRQELEVEPSGYTVNLATDVVLTTPWHRDRLSHAIGCIGPNRAWGPWTPDPLNHSIELWLPWRIAFVLGGNHSIAAGILAGEGALVPRTVYDMAPVLNQINCDGTFFTRLDGTACAQVFNARRAGAFLVGQIMTKTA
ncbi:DUF6710 family protein [Azospirillum sp. RU38E]|uniref:DUF6710 family protein n=1 Tax=unclassified Azospirillum TaxID=2630922 RepID=UPI00352A5D67